MNSQSVWAVWGIQDSLVLSFMVARALVMTGSEGDDEAIFSTRAKLIAQM